jgi:hypothetical protein
LVGMNADERRWMNAACSAQLSFMDDPGHVINQNVL